MNQRALHPGSYHQSPPTARTLLGIQRRGNGNWSMAVGALNGHASSCLIDNKVITAGLTFEEDIDHWLASSE